MKHSKQPTAPDKQAVINWLQENFGGGSYQDERVPATKLPANAVRRARNLLLFDDFGMVRPGTEEFSTLDFPYLLTGITATKAGTTITRSAGPLFTAALVDSYFVWPESGNHDLIIGYIDANTITVKQSDIEVPTSTGWIRGPVNAKPWWHEKSQKLFLFIDTRIFWTTWEMLLWTRVYPKATLSPTSSFGKWDEREEFLYLFSANGPFVVDTNTDPMFFHKINTINPTIEATEIGENYLRTYSRRYLVSMSYVKGNGANRTSGRLIQESGTCEIDATRDNRDYREQFGFFPIGDSVGIVTYLYTLDITRTILDFQALDDASIGITINGSTRHIVNDFTGGQNFKEFAAIMQKNIRETFQDIAPEARVICMDNGGIPRFAFYPGNTGGMIMGSLSDGELGATNLHVAYMDDWNFFTVAVERTVRGPTAPGYNSLIYPAGERHWNRFTVWGNLDGGPEGVGNDPEQYGWMYDLPCVRTVDAWVGNAVAPATRHVHIGGLGAFTPEDVGNMLVFADGSVVYLSRFISANEMDTPTAGAAIGGQGAAIGASKVMTASQTGGIITRTAGSIFALGDIGQTVYWADGEESYITRFIDASHVEVAEQDNRALQGAALLPTGRNFTDGLSDMLLKGRFEDFACIQRTMTQLPVTDVGVVVNGFLAACLRGGGSIYCSEMPVGKEAIAGYYNAYYQKLICKDAITELEQSPDKLEVFCVNSTWYTVTSQLIALALGPITLFKLPGLSIADEKIGLADPSGLYRIGNGLKLVITSEPNVRTFDGRNYSQSLAMDAEGRGYVLETIQRLQAAYAIGYDDLLGVIIWGSEEEPD